MPDARCRLLDATYRNPTGNRHPGTGNLYSLLKVSTGFASAARIAWKEIVPIATTTAAALAATKNHQLIVILEAKASSQSVIRYAATGIAIATPINTSLTKSVDNIVAMLITEAPST